MADANAPAGRVLFVTHNVPRFEGDAAGSFVLRLAVALRANNWLVDVLAPGAPELDANCTIEGVPIERVRYASDANMTLAYTGTMAEAVRGSLSGKVALFGLLRKMRARVKERLRDAERAGNPYSIVHAHWWFPSGLIAWTAGVGTARNVPLVITMHGSDVRLAEGVPASHGVMRRVLSRASVITAVSRWLAGAATKLAPSARIHVGPMPVDTAMFSAPSINAKRAGILFVGRLNEQKGVRDLLHALALMTDKAVTLTLVGDGPDEGALRTLAQSLDVNARISWRGALRQHDVVALYQQAAVVAIPSRNEGLGLVAVEAQLSETPVVAYASGGLVDIVLPEAGGTLVEVGNVPALAAALEQFAAQGEVSAARIREFGGRARQAMLNRFSPNVVAAQYIEWYHEAGRTP